MSSEYVTSPTPADVGDIQLHWEHAAIGRPEYVAVRGSVELGRIRLDGPAYWARRVGDPRRVLFVALEQAAGWLGRSQ